MEIATIGFTKSSAESFFDRVAASGVKRLGDVRLNNTSQLASFAKKPDLVFFLSRLCGVEYLELPELAPEEDMLKAYRAGTLTWDAYAERYLQLLTDRNVAVALGREALEPGIILLCSEHEPERCHRRLAAEYLRDAWGDISIRHL
ncbi:MAG: DUF488 domain-containing protein [Chloroflexi bacterium]|nr:DUF488 domain-containing protein [Chloroflexota bacterium]